MNNQKQDEWKAITQDGEFKRAAVYCNGGGMDISGMPDCISKAILISAAPNMQRALKSIANAHFERKGGKIIIEITQEQADAMIEALIKADGAGHEHQ